MYLPMHTYSAADIIRLLDLKPHPEGGHFRETFRDIRVVDNAAPTRRDLFNAGARPRSHWHRMMPSRVWIIYEGAPLVLDGRKRPGGRQARADIARASGSGGGPRNGRRESLGDDHGRCTVAPGFDSARSNRAERLATGQLVSSCGKSGLRARSRRGGPGRGEHQRGVPAHNRPHEKEVESSAPSRRDADTGVPRYADIPR